MRLKHCTQKLLKERKVTAPAKGLGNWYANLLRINRRRCILLTNEKSIYSFLVPNIKKENKVLGFMNDMAFQYDCIIRRAGEIEHMNLLEENSQVNRIPNNTSKPDYLFL